MKRGGAHGAPNQLFCRLDPEVPHVERLLHHGVADDTPLHVAQHQQRIVEPDERDGSRLA